MPESNTQLIDPEGQAVMKAFITSGSDSETAYNATQGIRKMSGDRVIAEIRGLRGEFHTLTADVQTLKVDVQTLTADVQTLTADVQTLKVDVQTLTADVETLKVDVETLKVDVQAVTADIQTTKVDVQTLTAELRAHEATSAAEHAAMNDRIGGSSTQLDIVSWAVIATFAMVTLLTATGMLSMLGLGPRRRKSKKRGKPKDDDQKSSEPTS